MSVSIMLAISRGNVDNIGRVEIQYVPSVPTSLGHLLSQQVLGGSTPCLPFHPNTFSCFYQPTSLDIYSLVSKQSL